MPSASSLRAAKSTAGAPRQVSIFATSDELYPIRLASWLCDSPDRARASLSSSANSTRQDASKLRSPLTSAHSFPCDSYRRLPLTQEAAQLLSTWVSSAHRKLIGAHYLSHTRQ